MKYYSTNKKAPIADLHKAVVKGLAEDRGLYMPEIIKKLPQDFFDNIEKLSFQEIAYKVADAFFGEDVDADSLKKIVYDTLAFDCPVVEVEPNIYSLELFHGPTLAFKDVGARFMARLLQYFVRQEGKEEVNVLVATSGDTGSAVANGFLGVEGIHVYVLYPKGKVSKIQESQFTTLGQNITALEVDGVFDDCQALVKSAFMDEELNKHMKLTSANSINVARFLPQAFYYFNAYARMKEKGLADKLVICVPSGNFGNITAGLFGHEMGLPIHRFIAANNANDIFYEYLQTGKYNPQPSKQTIANAMDVGDPSNFARIYDLYKGNHDAIAAYISGATYKDEQIADTRKKRYNEEETARLFSELQNMSAERKASMNSEAKRYRRKIRLNDVFETIERETGKTAGMEDIVPDSVRLKKLPEKLGQSVIGQSTATEAMARAVTRAKYGLRRKNRPLGVYLFAGPTGVGKTETAKKRLLGSDPGYVGYGETDTLIDKVNRQPESVILFDEIEKAHRSIFDLFLQLFDDGRLTNAQGKTGDFTKSLIIMTSNIGFERKEPTLGFGAEADREQAMIDSINDSLAGFFRPEFLNRIDEKIVFSSLDYDAVLKITDHLLEKEADMIAESGVRIRFSPEVAKFIADRYYDETNGARPIQRGIVREVEDVLTQSLMDGTVRKGKEAYADVFGGSIRIEPMLEVNLKPVDRQDECDLEERMNRAVDDVLKNMQ